MTEKPKLKPLLQTPIPPPKREDDYSDEIVRIRCCIAVLEDREDIYQRLADWAEAAIARAMDKDRIWAIANPLAPPQKRWSRLRHLLPPKALKTLATKLEEQVKTMEGVA